LRDENMWNNDQNIYGTSWKVIQNQVRQRDHYLCRICGKREQNTNHHIHHITPFRQFASSEQANQLDNLITLCPSCHLKAESVIRLRSGLSGLAYILHHLAPLFIMCDIADLGVYYEAESTLSQGHPIIALYDNVNGGIGLSAAVFDIHEQIIKSAYELISKCPCINGCPSCVGPCGERGIGSKAETMSLILAIDKVKDG
jgi:DEAD/DEAH box helicase domain-containing protein